MIFKNINSEDISGLIICSEPPISSSAIRTKETTIDGRDGAIVEKLGYKTRIRNVEIGLKKDANVDKILSYFSGEGDLIFKNENDKVYKAAIYEQVDLERLLRLRKGSVAFYCQPFKYKRNDIFETIKDNKVKEKKGKHLELLNCAEQNVVDLKLEGSTSQVTRSGKNLLDISKYVDTSLWEKTTNYFMFTPILNEDIPKFKNVLSGRMVLKGTAQNLVFGLTSEKTNPTKELRILNNGTLQNTSYDFKNADNIYLVIGNENMISSDKSEIGLIFNNYNIQIEQGTTATEYEQYGASPSPDYPSPIENVEGNIEIKDIGGNLLKNSSFTENLKDWDVVRTDNTTLSISEIFNKKCLHIKGGLNKRQYIRQPIQNRIQVGNKYTISCKAYLKDFVSGTTNPVCAFYLDGVGIDGKWIGLTYSGGQNFSDTKYNYSQGFIEVKTTITINKNTDLTKTFAMFVYARDFTGDLYIYDLQLEEGTTATPYKSYQEQKVDFPLSEGQKLYEGSYLASDGIHHKRKQRVFDGTEAWWAYSGYSGTGYCYQIEDNSFKFGQNVSICNKFKNVFSAYIAGVGYIGAYSDHRSVHRKYFISDKSTLTEWKTYLAEQYANGTPVIVEYELASEEIVPYTTEQQEAYNQLQKLKLYKGQNTMFSLEGSIINLKYLEDTDEKVENQGNIYSKPIIRLEKTVFKEVEIAINGIRFKYNFEEDDYVEIDCEEMTVQYEGLDRNRRLVIDFEFPKLKEGNNDIVMYSGDCIIKCKRKDRWL